MAVTQRSDQDVDDRDRRAATEAMVVVPEAPGIYTVYSGETETYRVDLVSGACECADSRYRDTHCKHLRRVEMALNIRDVPEGVRVGPTLRNRVSDNSNE